MPDVQSLVENKTRSDGEFNTSPQTLERAEIAQRVLVLFEQKRTMRDMKQPLFRDRTLKEYVDDCVKRFIQFKKRPAHKRNWQSNLASSTPNEKLIGILSRLATKGIEAKATTIGDLTIKETLREKVVNLLLKKAAVKNEDDFQIILEMLEALEKGTVFGLEDWYHGKRKVRDITSINNETGEMEFTEKTIKEWNDVRSTLLNINDFYPGDINVRPGHVQDMDDCFIRTVMNEDQFEEQFGKYPDADKVATVSSLLETSTPFWRQSTDVGNDQIELLRYFNKKTDEMIILANGIWINARGKKGIQPLPWNHKKLPVWGAAGEPLDANFLYGRSFIDKLISDVDSKDALFDRILDQATLAVSSPILASQNVASAMTKGFLQPNNVITTDWSNGRPNFEVLKIPDASNTSITLYQILTNRLEQSGLTSEVSGGVAPNQKTATQSNNEREGAMQMISLFLTMMERSILGKYSLRLPNILQFYSMPIHDNDAGWSYRRITLDNEQLSTGEVGKMHVSIVPEPSEQRVVEKDKMIPFPTEYIEATPDFIRNYQYELEIVPSSSIKMTEEQRQIAEVNWQRISAELFPDLVNRDRAFEDLALKFGKDPAKVKKEVQQDMGMDMPGLGGMPQLGGGMPMQNKPAPMSAPMNGLPVPA